METMVFKLLFTMLVVVCLCSVGAEDLGVMMDDERGLAVILLFRRGTAC